MLVKVVRCLVRSRPCGGPKTICHAARLPFGTRVETAPGHVCSLRPYAFMHSCMYITSSSDAFDKCPLALRQRGGNPQASSARAKYVQPPICNVQKYAESTPHCSLLLSTYQHYSYGGTTLSCCLCILLPMQSRDKYPVLLLYSIIPGEVASSVNETSRMLQSRVTAADVPVWNDFLVIPGAGESLLRLLLGSGPSVTTTHFTAFRCDTE